MKKYISITLLCLVLFNSLFAQRKKDDDTPVYKEGIMYALPRSVVRVEVEAEKESFFHGPYAEFADKLLGISNASSEDKAEWKLVDFKIDTYSEVDPHAVFQAIGEDAAMVSLSPEGLLLGINTDAEDLEMSSPSTLTFVKGDSIPAIIFPDLSMHDFLNDDDSTGVKNAKSLQEKALEAAHDITKLRKRLFLTLAANYEQLPPDGKAYQVMVDELKKIEKEYVALFIGKSFKQRVKYVYEYTPADKSVKGEVLFRFSAEKGVVSSSDLSARPIMLEVLRNDALNGAQVTTLAKLTNPYAGASGVFYRTPGQGTIGIVSSGNLLAEKKALFPQFGTVAAFPETYLNGNYEIQLHKATGAIKNVNQLKTDKK